MQLQPNVKAVFLQLSGSLSQLTDEQYIQPGKTLFNATIGQHVRHIIEMFLCLEKGYESGTVNYENRKRDLVIETNKDFAKSLLHDIYTDLEKPNKRLLLEANYEETSAETINVETNYYREIIYNLEHAVHHMALIRIGIDEVSSVAVPENFGVASSTIKYRKACAQ
jgi:hypothetical protein